MKLQLTMSTDYATHWELKDGVRELYANASDAVHADPAKYDIAWYRVEDENGNESYRLEVTNEAEKKLDPKHLVLGISGNREDNNAIGQFGEGLKMAFITALRHGLDIKVFNVNEVWYVSAEHSEQFGVELPTIDVHPVNKEAELPIVRVSIAGFTQEHMLECESLRFDPEAGADYPQLRIKDEETGIEAIYTDSWTVNSGLYVGGLAMGELCPNWVFNVPVSMATVNRDRKSPDNLEDIKKALGALLVEKMFNISKEYNVELKQEYKDLGVDTVVTALTNTTFFESLEGRYEVDFHKLAPTLMRHNAVVHWLMTMRVKQELHDQGITDIGQFKGMRLTTSDAVAKDYGSLKISHTLYWNLQTIAMLPEYSFLHEALAPQASEYTERQVFNLTLTEVFKELQKHMEPEEAQKKTLDVLAVFRKHLQLTENVNNFRWDH